MSSPPVYAAEVPAGIRPGDTFNVAIPNSSVRIPVRCPRGRGPGDRFQLHPFRVTLPEDVKKNRRFTTTLNGTPVHIRAPKKSKPGQVLTVYRAVFPTRGPKEPDNSKQNAWRRTKWADYLNELKEGTPGVAEKLVNKAMNIPQEEVPNEFICTITQEIMVDPVVAIDGNSYDRESIEQWFEKHVTSPKTNEQLPSTILIPNRALRSQIVDFLENFNLPMDQAQAIGEDSDAEDEPLNSDAISQPATTLSPLSNVGELASASRRGSATLGRRGLSLDAVVVQVEGREDVRFVGEEITTMGDHPYHLKAGCKYKIALHFSVRAADLLEMKMFIIKQQQGTDYTDIIERSMGNYVAREAPHVWESEEMVGTESQDLGQFVNDCQLMDQSGLLLEFCQQYVVVPEWQD